MTEHTTPTAAEVHAILTLSLQNSKALKGTHEHRAGVIMDDLSDAGLCITTMAAPKPNPDPERGPAQRDQGTAVIQKGLTATQKAAEPAINVVTYDTDGDQVSTGIPLPCSLGRDQEAREGMTRELFVADVDTFTEPRRIAIDYHEDLGGDTTDARELGWFDLNTIVRQLAEFAPDLVVVRREDLPEVAITEHMTEPTTCTVDIGGVRRFSGADWTHHSADDAMHLRSQLTDARMKLATAESTIEHQRGRIQTLTDACQRKNGDCERYATERREAIEARKAAQDEARDLRNRWVTYAAALARLEETTKPQVIGKHVVMRHETLVQLETECDQLAQERKDHEETRRDLRATIEHARKWQRFAAVIELMEDATDAELTIDGLRITPTKEN